MKSIIITAGAAIALGFITTTASATASDMNSDNSSPRKETAMQKIEHGSATVARTTVRDCKRLAHSAVRDSGMIAHATVRDSRSFAGATWDESKKIARTAVDSPVIAWQVVRGERPLFPRETASRDRGHREQIALGGHRKTSTHNEPPI